MKHENNCELNGKTSHKERIIISPYFQWFLNKNTFEIVQTVQRALFCVKNFCYLNLWVYVWHSDFFRIFGFFRILHFLNVSSHRNCGGYPKNSECQIRNHGNKQRNFFINKVCVQRIWTTSKVFLFDENPWKCGKAITFLRVTFFYEIRKCCHVSSKFLMDACYV